jgi:hypothetical protein
MDDGVHHNNKTLSIQIRPLANYCFFVRPHGARIDVCEISSAKFDRESSQTEQWHRGELYEHPCAQTPLTKLS